MDSASAHCRRSGLTLLEVLISCGILVVGLASVAAMLPAAGSRLAEATLEDRAGVLASNARADIAARGLLGIDLFAPPTKAVVFGRVLEGVPALGGGESTATAAAALNERIDPTRGFVLEDELVYAPSLGTTTPLNSFWNNNLGPREYKEAVCWGAMLAPTTYPAAAGSRAILGIAVFRKQTEPRTLQLTSPGGNTLFQYSTGPSAGVVDERTRRQYLKPCAAVILLPVAAHVATTPPAWARITSSWTNPGTGLLGTPAEADSRRSFVVLELDGVDRSKYVQAGPPDVLNVMAFDGLLRLDLHDVVLE